MSTTRKVALIILALDLAFAAGYFFDRANRTMTLSIECSQAAGIRI